MLTKKDIHLVIDDMIDELALAHESNIEAETVKHIFVWLNSARRRLLLRATENARYKKKVSSHEV